MLDWVFIALSTGGKKRTSVGEASTSGVKQIAAASWTRAGSDQPLLHHQRGEGEGCWKAPGPSLVTRPAASVDVFTSLTRSVHVLSWMTFHVGVRVGEMLRALQQLSATTADVPETPSLSSTYRRRQLRPPHDERRDVYSIWRMFKWYSPVLGLQQ